MRPSAWPKTFAERFCFLAEFRELRIRKAKRSERVAALNDERHHLVRSGHRQRLEEEAIHDAKNHRVSADAQGEREHNDRRDAKILAQHPRREAQVLPERLERRQPSPLAIIFFGLLHAAEFHDCLSPRLSRRHSRAHIVFHVKLQVAVDFRR